MENDYYRYGALWICVQKQISRMVQWICEQKITLENVFVVWACKTLQNYKALLSTTVSGDGIYAEYTYNGDKQEMYEDVYRKNSNRCLKSEWGDSYC